MGPILEILLGSPTAMAYRCGTPLVPIGYSNTFHRTLTSSAVVPAGPPLVETSILRR